MTRTCSVEGCDSEGRTRGLCNRHYVRQQRHGNTETMLVHRYKPGQTCALAECDKPVFCRLYCRPHYDRLVKYGRADGGLPVGYIRTARKQPEPRLPFPDRFWVKVEKTDTCWLWLGAKTKPTNGYGQARVPERGQVVAHRVAYELLVGPIPDGLELDHLCKVRLCVRPDHLEPVTPRENWRRGTSPTVAKLAQTHCKRGHEFTPENTTTANRGRGRRCKTCRRQHENARRAALR